MPALTRGRGRSDRVAMRRYTMCGNVLICRNHARLGGRRSVRASRSTTLRHSHDRRGSYGLELRFGSPDCTRLRSSRAAEIMPRCCAAWLAKMSNSAFRPVGRWPRGEGVEVQQYEHQPCRHRLGVP